MRCFHAQTRLVGLLLHPSFFNTTSRLLPVPVLLLVLFDLYEMGLVQRAALDRTEELVANGAK